ncbi:hypothetical protein WN944_005968 [Citrus x changshan-huyou]|uniref:Uncharacterized protein n=1 Tax=Citrus x changshan-huyou TaxID=2935761 RepID=A0AAP0MKX9_9ROSI
MVDAIVSPLVEQLTSFAAKEIIQQVKLVVGVEKEVKSLTSHLQAIQAVSDDAEEKQVKDKAIRLWLGRLKYASYDIEDVLDEWITARHKLQIKGGVDKKKKVCFCFPASCFGFKQVFLRHDIANKIKEVSEEIHDISTQKDMFKFESSSKSSERPRRVQSTSLIDDEEICGRVGERNALLSMLLCESSEQQKGLHIISIVGMGGIGKTTLAQLACNHVEVKRDFDKILWVCVSETFDEFRIAKAMLEALTGSTSNLDALQSLLISIDESIAGKRFLLVLDDVWDGDYIKWEPFYRCLKKGLHGSKILITTRKESIVSMMRSTDIISIKELAEEECWALFKRLAFFGCSTEECEKLEQIGQRIARKCKGLPLAAKTMGSLMSSKKTEEEWKRILNSDLWKVEEIEKGVLTPLWLSYNDLPSRVKRCFSYCAVFPKDYNIKKDKLITLWMAQGYLSAEAAEQDEELETIGEEYFGILASRSFFQEFEKSYDNRIIECKMHDMVHDFARFVSENECISLEVNGSEELNVPNSLDEKVRHLMLESTFPISTCRAKRIRSLLIECRRYDHSSLNGKILEELFRELTSLRALDFGGSYPSTPLLTPEIPRNIEKLVHLRYLNLSSQGIKKLPETLCELYNLEKLDISYCYKLEELPEGIGKLINMKHLLNKNTSSLRYMPVGIGRLTGLRTLGEFHVSAGGGVDGRKACRLESLKNLEHLQVCGIRRLGDVSAVGEAKRLELDKKKYLFSLTLEFDKKEEEDGERRKNEDDQLLLEALRPPLDLKELEIQYYRGNTVFPSWMTSLTNLKSLDLSSCENCEQLPPLGKLPSLEALSLLFMRSVKRVGDEFLGIESDHHGSSSSSSVIIAFPKLKSLSIEFLRELEEWDYGITRTGNTVINIMPRLSSLTIARCPKLKALPDHIHQTTTLKELSILACRLLKERYRKGEGEDWPKISHIPNTDIR